MPQTLNDWVKKAELIHHRGPWKAVESEELATLQWVPWFNYIRPLTSIGGGSPAEAEKNYWRQLAVSDTSTKVST